MLNRRLLLLVIFALLLAGLITLRGELLAFAIPFLVYLGVMIFVAPGDLKLKLERSLDQERVQKNTSVVLSVSLTNEGRRLQEVTIHDEIPLGLQVQEGKSSLVCSLEPGQTIQWQYTLLGGRGEYKFADLHVDANDPAAMFPSEITVSAPAAFLVEPYTPHLRPLRIRPTQTRGFAGPIPSRQSGSGIDFFGLREYQSGDPLRQINWKLIARHPDRLYSKLFEQERIADVGLILDARVQSNVELGGKSLFEYSVEAASGLADVFLREGNRVGLLVYGWGMDNVFPGYGKVQHRRIQKVLARAQPGLNYALESLTHLPTRFFPAHSQIILVSPLIPEDVDILIQLCANGYEVLVVSPDPVEFEAGMIKPQIEKEFAHRLAHLERYFMLQKIKRAGVQVVNWNVYQPLNQTLRGALSRPTGMQAVRKAVR